MSAIKWQSGPPPHVGWWSASTRNDRDAWRWWDGKEWSQAARNYMLAADAAKYASRPARIGLNIIAWNESYPENARVPRVAP